MSNETQRCYICGRYFDDKVKLGLHLSPCYSEAVTVRREMWHPHPLDLVDEQRYTEYMRGKFKEREREITEAQRRGVSFVTASNFDDIKTSLSPPRNIPASGMGIQRPTSRNGLSLGGIEGRSSSGLPVQASRFSNPPSTKVTDSYMHGSHEVEKTQREQLAIPVRQVVTGVTSLRNELADELVKIRQLRQTEEQLLEDRQRVFEELCGQIGGAARSRKTLEDSSRFQVPAPVSPTRLTELPRVRPPSASSQGTSSPSHAFPLRKVNPQRQPSSVPSIGNSAGNGGIALTVSSMVPTEMEDGRVKCPWCGKLFGRKGYEVHAKRCSRPDNGFTWSRDAEYVKDNPEERVKADHDRVSYGRQFEQTTTHESNGSPEAWQQFMITYPRPILPDKPSHNPSHLQQRPVSPARQNALKQMVDNELSRRESPGAEATAPCGRCGRYFYHSRLAMHESSCVAKPRR